MTRIEIKASRARYSILLITAAAFVAAGIFIILTGGPAWIGWMNIVFFGCGGIPIFVWQLIDSRPRLVVDDDGVFDRTLGVGKIPWDEITGAYKKTIQGSSFVCLHLLHPEIYAGKLGAVKRSLLKTNQKLGFTSISLNLSGTATDPDQVVELVLKMVEMKRNGGNG
jgi:hypothetical protein